jgi:hypothetical protein
MNLLDELKSIRHLLDLIPSDNVPKSQAQNFNLAKNRLMDLIAKGERVEAQKNLAVSPKPRVRIPPAEPECEVCQ